jgi:hypothetical protein
MDNTEQSSLPFETDADTNGEGLVLSGYYRHDNADVFPRVLQLYADYGDRIADLTWGHGSFWKKIPESLYDVYGTDINPEKSPTGESVDARQISEYYADEDPFDVVVFDPPYAEGYFRRHSDMMPGQGSHEDFRSHYSQNSVPEMKGSKWHQCVVDLYCEVGAEAQKILKDDGRLVVKVGDEVSAGKQELTHIQITNFYESALGMYTKDCFVMVREKGTQTSGVHTQQHARKNHTFFMIYEMDGDPINIKFCQEGSD